MFVLEVVELVLPPLPPLLVLDWLSSTAVPETNCVWENVSTAEQHKTTSSRKKSRAGRNRIIETSSFPSVRVMPIHSEPRRSGRSAVMPR